MEHIVHSKKQKYKLPSRVCYLSINVLKICKRLVYLRTIQWYNQNMEFQQFTLFYIYRSAWGRFFITRAKRARFFFWYLHVCRFSAIKLPCPNNTPERITRHRNGLAAKIRITGQCRVIREGSLPTGATKNDLPKQALQKRSTKKELPQQGQRKTLPRKAK